MKHSLLLICLFVSYQICFAQVPEDALKFSWYTPAGTARTQAIGGAIGALGGDVSSNNVNPAGLGFYKTSDFIISPGFSMLQNNSTFRGDSHSENKSFFNLGTSGAVFGTAQPSSAWNGSAFSLSVSTLANFNSRFSYSGKNNFSSYGEQYAEEAYNSGHQPSEILDASDISLGTKLAFYTYLLDTASIPGHTGVDYLSMALWNNLKNNAAYLVNQQNTTETSGGITEISLAFAGTRLDKFYLGGALGIPIMSYTRNNTFTETDATGNPNSNFEHSTLTETYTTKGVGANLKIGAIYKPMEALRLGLAIHSPTFYGLKDTYWASMTTNTENYVHTNNSTITASTDQTLGVYPEYKYNLTTPWRFIASGAYVIGAGQADVTQQKGFITADIEYVTYKSNSYKTGEDDGDNSYYDGVNQAIKAYYKNAFNFRVGGEMKFNTIMARLGFSYLTNPYKDPELDGKKMYVSGGIGYRNAGFFLDLTYVQGILNDINFPYRLSDKANTFATIKGMNANVALTVGLKF